MPRVLIVDDHPIVRMGLRAMLEQAPGFEVCGEAGSTTEALRLLSAQNPDVTLLDLMLGGRGGADFVTECLHACPQTRILVLSQHDEALYAERVLKAGAHGYLMKGEALEGVVDALETVLRGDIAVSARMNARLLARRFRGPTDERYAELSNREMQIFLLIGKLDGQQDLPVVVKLSIHACLPCPLDVSAQRCSDASDIAGTGRRRLGSPP
jgi:DNA-binding NarL/FixJ family response regulator